MAISPRNAEKATGYTRYSQRKDTPHGTTLSMAHTGSDSNLVGPETIRHTTCTVSHSARYMDGE